MIFVLGLDKINEFIYEIKICANLCAGLYREIGGILGIYVR
jgi:hypothetical protein